MTTTTIGPDTTRADRQRVPLSVLDVVPISEGSDARAAIANTLDLAEHAEALGYRRYWLTEHHLNRGIAGSAGHTLLPAIGERTSRIRIGTAATLLGNYRLVQVAETFGVLDALYPGRVDLGLGRSGSIPAVTPEKVRELTEQLSAERERIATEPNRIVDGLVVPPKRRFPYFLAERFRLQERLFARHAGDTTEFGTTVDELRALFAGTSTDPEAGLYVAPPANGADVDIWVHGSSAGISAQVAGERGLPFGSNYHTAPSNTIESVEAYRAAFRPSERLSRPYVIVSADVLAADTEDAARRAALGYAHWVHSIRSPKGTGAIPFPSPEWASAHPLDPDALEGVRDRLDTRFVGDPDQVVDRLEALQRATGADELLLATEAYSPADRVRSAELVAEAWGAVAPEDASARRPSDTRETVSHRVGD